MKPPAVLRLYHIIGGFTNKFHDINGPFAKNDARDKDIVRMLLQALFAVCTIKESGRLEWVSLWKMS